MRNVIVMVLAIFAQVGTTARVARGAERFQDTLSSAAEAVPLDSYPLDKAPRELPVGQRVQCPESDLIRYRGSAIAYHKATRVHREFARRLALFEDVVKQVATRIYGRAPQRIRHIGGFVCRRMKTFPTYLSEHALGNALDIEGFDFGPQRGRGSVKLPRTLRRSFSVRIAKHWSAERGAWALHSRFLRELAQELITRPDVFRVMLGPSYPQHHDHFHFDMSPWRMIEF